MIKAEEYTVTGYDETTPGKITEVKASLSADTSAEVIAMGDTCLNVEGIQDGIKLAPFSDCFTAEQELGVINSLGVWNF